MRTVCVIQLYVKMARIRFRPSLKNVIGISSFVEPSCLAFEVQTNGLDFVNRRMKKILGVGFSEDDVAIRCRDRRIARVKEMNAANDSLVGKLSLHSKHR
jgi:hypothetical protein